MIQVNHYWPRPDSCAKTVWVLVDPTLSQSFER